MAALSSCDRDHMAHKSQSIYYLTLYSKSVAALAIRQCHSSHSSCAAVVDPARWNKESAGS